MKRIALFAPWILAVSLPALAATAGQSAPDFKLTDSHGKSVQLSDFKGKFVVLEWTNPGCPFVRNQYNTRNMQSLQSEWVAKNVVWLSIDSNSRSSYDFLPPEKLSAWMQAKGAAQSAVLVDAEGAAAKLYQAKTTPHMFVIDPQGRIVYAGAIDDRPSTRPADPPEAHNYVRAALTEATSGKPVTTAATTPYGCSVKY
jgi:peroxiredoxin